MKYAIMNGSYLPVGFKIIVLIIFMILEIRGQDRYYGDSSSLAGGKIKSWIEVDSEYNTKQIGISLNKNILSVLPESFIDISLNLPRVANDSLFKHIFFNWNPGGHPPMTVYGLPHFDIHFYIITPAERRLIQGGYDNVSISSEFIPADYTFIPEEEYLSVPQMGVHYSDSLASEFKGEIFTRTFIYGFYTGKMIFVEPMITKDYLLSVQNELIPIKLPEAYQAPGYYPKSYEVKYNPTEDLIDIIINDMVYHSVVTAFESTEHNIISDFSLLQNYPNPFNPSTKIQFDLPTEANVEISVYNSLGEKVADIINELKKAGHYEINWNASLLSSGIYFCKMEAAGRYSIIKMILMK